MLFVQIGTMKCLYCPQKDACLVPWDSSSPSDQTFLWGKSSSAPQSVVSGLQVPSAPLVVSVQPRLWPHSQWNLGLCSLQPSASVAESSSAATGPAAHPPSTSQSDGQKVHAKPSHPDTLKKAKKPHVLNKVTIAERVEKYGKYGSYDNSSALYCKLCGQKKDETQKLTIPEPVTL